MLFLVITGTQESTDVGVGTYNEDFRASGLLESTPIMRPCKRPCLELGEEEVKSVYIGSF